MYRMGCCGEGGREGGREGREGGGREGGREVVVGREGCMRLDV